MGSVRVENEIAISDDLISSIEENAAEVAERAVAALLEASGGKSKTNAGDVRATLDGIRLGLAALKANAKQADQALEEELGDDKPILDKRDAQLVALARRLVRLRTVLTSLVGPEGAIKAGFSGATPDDPASVIKLARGAYKWLHGSGPKSSVDFAEFNAKGAARGLDDEADALEASEKLLVKEKREEQSARAKRDEALAALVGFRVKSVPVVEGLYRLAGMDHQADRLVKKASAATHAGEEPEPEPTPEK